MRHRKKAAKHHTAGKGEAYPTPKSILKSACFAFFIAGGIGVLLLLLSAALLLLTKNPSAYVKGVALALLYITAALTGVIATLWHKKRLPLFCGLAAGIIWLALLLPTAIFLPRAGAEATALRVGLYAAIPFFTVAGALLAARKPSAPKRRKRAF